MFYEPAYYFQHPFEILMPWKGGLASHGGGIGILIAIYIFCKKYTGFRFTEVLDVLAVGAPTTGAFIRLGNLFNSEIVGKVTDVPWAFIFPKIDFLPRHPSQLYEAIMLLFVFYLVVLCVSPQET